MRVSVAEALGRMGGIATRRALLRACTRQELDRALEVGDVVKLLRGRYALPDVGSAREAAHRANGVVSHRSACLEHGWELKTVPRRPEVTVPRHRRLTKSRRAGTDVTWADLTDRDIDGIATSRDRTLADCLRRLPWDEALTIADSALRHGFSPLRLKMLAAKARGPGSAQMRRVAREATQQAANPFESVARAIGLDVEGLDLRPQVSIYEPELLGRPDLVDTRLRILVECDSFEWHSSREALERDARRYTRLAVAGWIVIRLTYDDVMRNPAYVREVLMDALATRRATGCAVCRVA